MPISVAEEIQQLRSIFWSDRDPDGRVFVPLADAYRRQGDHDQALALLEEGLARQLDFAPAHVVSGWVRRDRGEREAAAGAFRAALALDEENAEALRALEELRAAAPPPAAEPVPVESAAADEEGLVITRTMADLYARQGLSDRALTVLRRLLERDPGDETVRARIAELEVRTGGAAKRGAPDVEKLARDWAEGPRDTGELSTPFAWTSAAKPAPAKAAGPAARDYFRGLLEWEPGVRAAAQPAPAAPVDAPPMAEASVTPATVEPTAAAPVVDEPVVDEPVVDEPVVDEPVAEDTTALEPVALAAAAAAVAIAAPAMEVSEEAVTALEAAPEPVVSIASLAPTAVPISSLSPDAVPIASLAPDAVPISSLAPGASEPERDFSSWYSRLR